MTIRHKQADDDAACVELMWQTHQADGYPRYWPGRLSRFLRPRQQTDAWVAEVDGRVVGHVALHDAAADPTLPAAQRATGLPAHRLAVVARLLVEPAARGTGTGRALLSTAVAHAAATDRRSVLDVLQEFVVVVALDEALGWTRSNRWPWTLSGWATAIVSPLQLWMTGRPIRPETGQAPGCRALRRHDLRPLERPRRVPLPNGRLTR